METTVRLDACQFWALWSIFIGLIASIMLLSSRLKEQKDYFKEQDKIDRMGE